MDTIGKKIRRLIRKIDGSHTVVGKLNAIEAQLKRMQANAAAQARVPVLPPSPPAVKYDDSAVRGRLDAIEKVLMGRLSSDEYEQLGISLERMFHMLDRVEQVIAGSLSDEQVRDETMSYEKLVRDMEVIKPKVNALFSLYKAVNAGRLREAIALAKLQENSEERSDFGKYREHFPDSRAEFHLDRYRFAATMAGDKSCLDIACGTGYGSALIGENAKSVLGVDISADAIDHACNNYQADHISFLKGQVGDLEVGSRFDLIACFETIEHVDDPEGFLAQLAEHFAPEATLIISAPNDWQDLDINPYHKTNFDRESFSKLLETQFEKISFYRQNSGSPGRENNNGRSRAIMPVTDSDALTDAECLIAVCRK